MGAEGDPSPGRQPYPSAGETLERGAPKLPPPLTLLACTPPAGWTQGPLRGRDSLLRSVRLRGSRAPPEGQKEASDTFHRPRRPPQAHTAFFLLFLSVMVRCPAQVGCDLGALPTATHPHPPKPSCNAPSPGKPTGCPLHFLAQEPLQLHSLCLCICPYLRVAIWGKYLPPSSDWQLLEDRAPV